MKKMPLSTCRSFGRGLPRPFLPTLPGSNGAMIDHSQSRRIVRSWPPPGSLESELNQTCNPILSTGPSRSRLAATCTPSAFLVAASDCPASAEDAGLRLAQHWCSGCHTLDDTPSATDVAPSFPEITRARGQDRRWLTAWLMAPHPQMHDKSMRLDLDQISVQCLTGS